MRHKAQHIIIGLITTLWASQTYGIDQSGYDFSPAKSIWGSGPTRDIEPEEKPVDKEQGDMQFNTVDLSGLNMERKIQISQRDIKLEIKRTRVIKQTAPLLAEDSHTHLGLGFIGGFSALTCKSDFGTMEKTLSPGISLDYKYFFHSRWGASIGVDLIWANSTFKSKGRYYDEYTYTDYEGDELHTKFDIAKVEEKFTAMMLQIPLMACYDYKDWMLSAGFKFGFPFNLKYDQSLVDANITVDYPFSFEIEDAACIGARSHETIKSNGKFGNLQTYVMLTGDFGHKFRLTDCIDLGASVFIDYALNSVKMRAKNDDGNEQYGNNEDAIYSLIKTSEIHSEKDLPVTLQHASTLCSKQMSTGTRLIDEFHHFNVGLRLVFYFSSYGNESAEGKNIIDRLVRERKESLK